MLDTLISHVATIAGIEINTSREAVGIILNAAERQGAPFADAMYENIPGARPLAATMGAEVGAATGEIARLIERTPGGRRHVTAMMISDMQARGIGHKTIGEILPAISSFASEYLGLEDFGHLGDLLGKEGEPITREELDTIRAA